MTPSTAKIALEWPGSTSSSSGGTPATGGRQKGRGRGSGGATPKPKVEKVTTPKMKASARWGSLTFMVGRNCWFACVRIGERR
eukprot:9229261-Alexandrium_andersonii.AAC.1